jgi:hypothetical protein
MICAPDKQEFEEMSNPRSQQTPILSVPHGKGVCAMIERRYQLTLDFKVLIKDITKESVTRDYRHRRGFKEAVKDPEFWELIDAQRQLLKALIQHEDIIHEFIKRTIIWQIEQPEEGILGPTFHVRLDDENMLGPVIAELDEGPKSYFEEGIEYGEVGDYIEQVTSSIKAIMTRATLTEL